MNFQFTATKVNGPIQCFTNYNWEHTHTQKCLYMFQKFMWYHAVSSILYVSQYVWAVNLVNLIRPQISKLSCEFCFNKFTYLFETIVGSCVLGSAGRSTGKVNAKVKSVTLYEEHSYHLLSNDTFKRRCVCLEINLLDLKKG